MTNRLQALCGSKYTSEAFLQKVYSSTHAVIFFGTPHRGSGFATVIKPIVKLFGANSVILKELEPNSDHAEKLRKGFAKMVIKEGLKSFSFLESKTLGGAATWLNKQVFHITSILLSVIDFAYRL